MFDQYVGLDQPLTYEIKLQGRAAADLSDWFQGEYQVWYEAGDTHPAGLDARSTITCIRGRVADQAALHGLLACVRDLGFLLLYVDCQTARSTTRSAASDENLSVE